MATWPELKNFIKENFTISKESDNSLFLSFQTFDDRTQSIFVHYMQQDSVADFVTFASPVADVASVSAEKLLETSSFLGYQKFGDRYYVSDIVFLDDLDPSEVGAQFDVVTKTADVTEHRLTGGDKF